MKHLGGARILMYSHDTFGLGHLRRCRAIAHSLVENYPGLSILIVSGSAIAGAFDFRARVDFVKVPSVIKLRNGEYTSMDQHIDIRDTIRMRKSIIHHTAKTFQPDVFIVDKEPMGLKGEITETLAFLKSRGTTLVLGLRDVLDSPDLLAAEWKRKDLVRKIDHIYDHIWVYGPEYFHDPLSGLNVPATLRSRVSFLGFLKRQALHAELVSHKQEGEFILITAGGGGDGVGLIRSALAAYEHDTDLNLKAVVVLGPYMPGKERVEFMERSEQISNIQVIDFDSRMEELISSSTAVVSMGGYNTFCEILSFDKPALIIPRTVPRKEQLLRTRRAAELGLVDMLLPDDADKPDRMAGAIRALPSRPKPSERSDKVELDGLTALSRSIGEIFEARKKARETESASA
ncbi:MAG: glycosyltransferase family protein [Granulosicoccus sp.]|nr:glycosyltransferase family protein [Granulosicoccus sp.]